MMIIVVAVVIDNWVNFLQIYNTTNSSNATPVARLCGSAIPAPIFLNTNVARIQFVTDESVTHRGYDITYTSSPLGGCSQNAAATNTSF